MGTNAGRSLPALAILQPRHRMCQDGLVGTGSWIRVLDRFGQTSSHVTAATTGATTRLSSKGRGILSATAAAKAPARAACIGSRRLISTAAAAAHAAAEPTQLFRVPPPPATPPPHRVPTIEAAGSAKAAASTPAAAPGKGTQDAAAYPATNQNAPLGLRDSSGRNTGNARAMAPRNPACHGLRPSPTTAMPRSA